MGHYGRTKIVKLDINFDLTERGLKKNDKIDRILNYKPVLLQTDKVKLKNNIFKKII
jgi:hypothetical protein